MDTNSPNFLNVPMFLAVWCALVMPPALATILYVLWSGS